MIRFIAMLLLPVGIGGCSGEPDDASPSEQVKYVEAVDGALMKSSWPARMANDEFRAPFEGHAGWQHFFANDLGLALAAFRDSKHARGMARVHQLMSAMYAQGALLAANASAEAYGVDGVETDPVEMTYILGVSAAIRGDTEEAIRKLSEVPASSQVSERAAAWQSALQASNDIPPLEQLTKISGALGEVVPGTEPAVQDLPHFEFPERSEKARMMAVNDPTALLTLSAWHATAAEKVAPETDESVLRQVAQRYAIRSGEAAKQAVLPIDDAWLFWSTDLAPADTGFVAEAKANGIRAVADWANRSPLAAALQPAVKSEKLDPQAVMDSAFGVQKQLAATMADIGGGEQGFHRPFTVRARIAVLLAGMVVADANDQYRDAGILRLNALERMEAQGIEPVFALSVAAWDAANRNPMRPEDILHQFGTSYPALTAAKAALDALHLRRSRNAAPSTPTH